MDNNSYQNIKQAWGEPTRTDQKKTSRQEMENFQVPVQVIPPPSKKKRHEDTIKLSVIENKIIEGQLEDVETEEKIGKKI